MIENILPGDLVIYKYRYMLVDYHDLIGFVFSVNPKNRSAYVWWSKHKDGAICIEMQSSSLYVIDRCDSIK